MPQWYYGSSAGQNGPVEEQELRALIASGGVGPETLVWREGMRDWNRLDTVPELSGMPSSPYAPPGSTAAGYPGYYPPLGPANGLAIASMVCGIVCILICYFAAILGIPAVICGHMALSQIRNAGIPVAGRGMAIAGLILGYLGILFSLSVVVIFVIAIVSSNL